MLMTASDGYFPVQTQQKKHQIKPRNISKFKNGDISQGRCSNALIPNSNSTPCHNVPITNPKQIDARWKSWQGISSTLALIKKS